ncbi:MAG: hypothetical protein M3Y42_04055 [Actinomycetota bacterium]|nr:hypothetical protein [Actinomycetota bacterium]
MTVLFSAVLLVLALAVVMLFAMIGELASRVEESGHGVQKSLMPLEEAQLGHRPSRWPAELGELPESATQSAAVLVLSASCRSCGKLAKQLVSERSEWAPRLHGVVISAASLDRAREFQQTNELYGFNLFLDDGGEWTTGEFGIQTSPVALMMRDGRLDAAYILDDLNLLAPLMPLRTEAV